MLVEHWTKFHWIDNEIVLIWWRDIWCDLFSGLVWHACDKLFSLKIQTAFLPVLITDRRRFSGYSRIPVGRIWSGRCGFLLFTAPLLRWDEWETFLILGYNCMWNVSNERCNDTWLKWFGWTQIMRNVNNLATIPWTDRVFFVESQFGVLRHFSLDKILSLNFVS